MTDLIPGLLLNFHDFSGIKFLQNCELMFIGTMKGFCILKFNN